MIVAPSHLAGIGIEIGTGDVVMRSDLGAAQAAQIALRLIGTDALIDEGHE